MTNIRVQHDKNRPYVCLNKVCLEDKNLSWAAKGLWSYLLSRPDDWHVSVNHLKTIFEERGGGREAIQHYLNELIREGYCERIQTKNDDGTFGKVEYVVYELKIKLPQTGLPLTDRADAVETPILSNDCLPSNERTTTAAQPVAVFSCLKDIAISDKEKQWICKTYDEPTVANAVAAVSHETFDLKTTLAQAIKWACKEKIQPPPSQKDIVEENKAYVEQCKATRKLKSNLRIDIARSYLEIVYLGCQKESYVIEFMDKKFKEKLTPFFE